MTVENVVYIPTMGRLENLKAVVPAWIEQDIQVRLLIERYQYPDHAKLVREMRWGDKVTILTQPLAGRGIGYARKYCIQHANSTGLKSIIMSDDDLRPKKDSDMVLLLDEADKPYVAGVGAVRPIYDLYTGGATARLQGAILCPGGLGTQTYGLNVETILRLGNFNPALHTLAEDSDMIMRSVEAGMPWRIHCDARMDAIGKRYDPGGINTRFSAPDKRTEAENECWAIMHKRWPDIVSISGKKPRMAWKKLYDKYIPEWHEYSAIHGGSLDAYDNSPIEAEND